MCPVGMSHCRNGGCEPTQSAENPPGSSCICGQVLGDGQLLTLSFARYDSLTGVPSHQRALAFEKGSVLFNIGALHTQIGARQDRASLPGLNQAIDAFQKAAGMWVSPFPSSPWACRQHFHRVGIILMSARRGGSSCAKRDGARTSPRDHETSTSWPHTASVSYEDKLG